MDLGGELLVQVDRFLTVLPRLSGVVLVAPVFGGRYPAQVKAGLAAALALVLMPVVPPAAAFSATVAGYLGHAVGELLVGLAVGYASLLTFAAVQVAGQLVDMEMGFGIVNVVDPYYGTQVPLVGNFLHLLALIGFLLVDGHHVVLAALKRSFDVIPPGAAAFKGELAGLMVAMLGETFLTGVKIAAPVLGVLFVTNVSLGIVARTVPQMNVFVVGLPVKILVGTAMLLVVLSAFSLVVKGLLGAMVEGLGQVLELLQS
mgnify:CR=1 FL=1